MSNIQTHVAGKLVRRITQSVTQGTRGLRRDGPVYYAQSGPWKVTIDANLDGELLHYETKMLAWRYEPRTDGSVHVNVTGTWTGYGSVSDQTGVNAALWALGSPLRYSRDARGGGPRVNPLPLSTAPGGLGLGALGALVNPRRVQCCNRKKLRVGTNTYVCPVHGMRRIK